MKVKSIETRNFGRLGDLSLDKIHQRNSILLSGRNGVGKSQILLAISVSTSQYIDNNYNRFIGPSAESAEIWIQFELTPDERRQVNMISKKLERTESLHEAEFKAHVRISRTHEVQVKWEDSYGDPWIDVLRSNEFARESLPFLEVIYLPSNRLVSRAQELNLPLHALGKKRSSEVNRQFRDQEVAAWDNFHTMDVFASLVAMHYANTLEGKQGSDNDFQEISNSLYSAIGKRIQPPSVKPDGSIMLEVELPNQTHHPIQNLSSGELGALQLLFFVRWIARKGAVLLIDEPENHLHPSLQTEVINTIREVSGDGQTWVATHSVSVLSASDPKGVLVLSHPKDSTDVNAQFADLDKELFAVLQDIGVSPGVWLPGSYLLIVEGKTDSEYLKRLLPKELRNAFVLVAGDSSSVRQVATQLRAQGNVPFLAILDRDGRSAEAVRKLEDDTGCFIWDGYAIESAFLDVELLHSILGKHKWNQHAIESELQRVYENSKSSAQTRWIISELERQIPTMSPKNLTVEEILENQLFVSQQRSMKFLEVGSDLSSRFEEVWQNDPRPFVNPKDVLAQFQQKAYKGLSPFMNEILDEIIQGRSPLPSDIAELKRRIADVVRNISK